MLDEFQLCLKDVSKLAKDGEQVVQDLLHFKFSHFFKPLIDMGKLIWDLPDAFADCGDMDNAIAAIIQWAKIFEHP